MTHAETVAALKGDHRSDSSAERHGVYAIRRPVLTVTDPRPPLKQVTPLHRWQ